MKHRPQPAAGRRLQVAGLMLALCPAAALPQTISFAQSPLFLGTTVKPNVLAVYDNSQSMDGTMAGKLIAGSDASTRGNIARSVLRSTITSYRDAFRWGLASFGLKNQGLYTTYAYYFGSDAEVVYTNSCVDGVSPANANRRCVANPQPANGFNFITYALTGDDPAINDVLYSGDFGPQLYGIGVNGTTKYEIFKSRGAGVDWNSGNFSGGQGTWTFTPTDAGYLPTTPPNRREFFIKRAWGYNGDISGIGVVNRAVADDSAAHYTALMGFLAVETNNNATTELKNAAVFTPLAGTVGTARDYFANAFSGSGKPSPISQSCQRNFVLLATDGNPTGKTDGSMYTLAEQANTYSAATQTWTWSTAAKDVFDRIAALRSVAFGAKNYDVQTYVIGMGDSVANQSSVAVLNRMADLGGTSKAYLASNEEALKAAFQKIAVDITSKTAAASAVSLNSGSWNTGSRVYQGRFSSGDWSGQLLAFKIGENGEPDAVPDWDAGQVLNGLHWSNDRQVLTYKASAALGSRGVAFRWPANPASPGATEIDTGMSTALGKDSLGNADAFGANRLEYLRGNTAREVAKCGACAAPTFRNRTTTVLGDIIGSAPVYVGGATGDYRDTIESSAYSTYAVSRVSKTPMIFVGANDGMLHAFKASDGTEVFAYVPWAVRNKLSALTAPTYSHQYTVDGSPAVGDVYYGGAWRTLLVSGMSAGAKGVFALDVSDSANFTEAKADKVVRWEIDGSDGDMGHVMSRPVLAKTRDGKWRAIFGNGYNSSNGHAVLMLVDLQTGAVSRVDTNSGAADTPNGLSGIAAVSSAENGVVDIVYAGDLYGNVWRFDLSSPAPGSWKVFHKVDDVTAPLFKAAAGQQITARPDVARHPKGGYLVTVGTGRYIDIVDNTTDTSQTIYGLWDKGSTVAMADLQTQLIDGTAAGGSGKIFRLTTHAVGKPPDALIVGDNVISVDDYYATRKGWKMTLPTTGERVVSEASVRFGRVIVSTLIPSTVICSYGGDGWIMDVDVITGNRSPALDTNGDNEVNVDDYINGRNAGGVKIGAIPAAASIMRSKKRNLDDKLVNTSDGSIVRVRENGNQQTSRRAAWEQIR